MNSPISRRTLLIAGASTAVVIATPGLAAANHPSDVVNAWNQALLRILRTPGAQPPTLHPTRSFAILHAAIHNAVVATTGRGTPYLYAVHAAPGASSLAAAAQAAHDVLVALYPSLAATLDQQLAADLSTVTGHRAREAGVLAGRLTARRLLEIRSTDGSSVTPPPLAPGTRPGEYRPTPPAFAPAVFTHWAAVTPFLIGHASRFRPAPYPSLHSRPYAAAIIEVTRLGQDTSTARTPDQTVQANFWAAPIWNYWNEITQTLAVGKDLASAARIFARVNLAVADAVIAFYDAKYHYRIWRPITAIRQTDPTWTSLATTPPDPSYPGAHSAVSTTAATLLIQEFPVHPRLTVTSDALPGVVRHFTSLHSAATEAGLSRLYAGLHTRLDHHAGQHLGHTLANSIPRL